ncbi:SAM-dependent methyltransferase [Haloactinopolyspora sp.]|uniref:SAM-dependent methyltransferase n=1 Tax=Haloactinopolyspora sp. TaxID=1966353 RepID=UPI0026168031|nr:SAM-dependent methyltransferase [Haloactinopolyspora sp.]
MTPADSADKVPPVGVDPTRPSVARMYDAALGGKDNYEIDRAMLAQVQQAAPHVIDLARAARAFLIRVARFLAYQTDITQFIDCGSGLPTAENTHEVLQRVNPDARVVYIDNDPVVMAHGRALLADNEKTFLAGADVFEPQQVLQNKEVREHLDLSEPVGLLHISTLHYHVGAADGPAKIMREYVDALAPGSYVAIAHMHDPENEYTPMAREVEQIMRQGVGAATFRTKAQIEELFTGLELLPPGVVPCVEWWPDGPQLKQRNEVDHLMAGGVARKL